MNREFMESAVWQAEQSYAEGGLPIGAALAHESRIISVGHNRRHQHLDPIAHAELDCLRNAGLLTAKTYEDSILYSTLSPCWMCAGAIRLYGVRSIVVADAGIDIPGQERWRADKAFFDAAGIDYQLLEHETMADLFRRFLNERPELWSGDVGELPA